MNTNERGKRMLMNEQWEGLAAVAMPPVRPRRHQPGDAAWLIRSPEGTSRPWAIHASHRPGIVHHDVTHGPDAWRVNVQVHEARVEETQGSPENWFAAFDVITSSEAEALQVVEWLLSEAAKGEQ